MKDVRMIPMVLSALLATACTTTPAPNDTASRALNEMRAVADRSTPKPDPKAHDCRAAAANRRPTTQNAERDAELVRLRSSLGGEVDQAKARVGELESQISQRDRELASLRNASGDKDRLASQLSDAERQLSSKDQELAALKTGAGDKDHLARSSPPCRDNCPRRIRNSRHSRATPVIEIVCRPSWRRQSNALRN